MAHRTRALEIAACVVLVLGLVLGVGYLASGRPAPSPLRQASASLPDPAQPTGTAEDPGEALLHARRSALPGIEDAVTLFPKPPAATTPPAPEFGPDPETPRSAEFTVSSFNVLGSSHTNGGPGRKGRMAPGPTRAVWAAELVARHDATVVGFQELQGNQLRVLQRVTNLGFYPGLALGRRAGENSVGWRQDTWELVSARTVAIPYFRGRIRPMPVVRLRHRATGLEIWFANFHNPATTPRWGDNAHWRAVAADRQVALANSLAGTGVPVFFAGDFNEREVYFCRLTGGAAMRASNGGSNDAGCRPPAGMNVDWIFGSDGVEFLTHVADRSPLVRRATDHPVVVSKVRIGGTAATGGLDGAAQDALEALREGHG